MQQLFIEDLMSLSEGPLKHKTSVNVLNDSFTSCKKLPCVHSVLIILTRYFNRSGGIGRHFPADSNLKYFLG